MVLIDFATGNQVVAGDNVTHPQAPSEQMVMDLFQNYRQYFEAFRGRSAFEDEHIDGDRVIPVPDDMPIDEIRPATAHAIVSTLADHVDTANPSIFVPEPSPRAKARAERIQKFLQGIWLHIDDATKRNAVKHEAAYGVGWLKTWWDGDKWPDAPLEEDFDNIEDYKDALADHLEERNIAFPFVVDVVNPQNLLWDVARTGPKWAIEYYEANVYDIQRLYPEWIPLHNGDTATFMEYWDDTWHMRFIDEQLIWGPFEHGYGFMPYVPIEPGTTMSFNVGPPDRRYEGILRPVHNLLDAEARLITQYEAILRQHAWRTIDFAGPPNAAETTAERYELFASKNIVLPGVEVAASPLVQPPQEILQQLANVQTMIEEATFPNVVRGLRPSGVSTGFAISVLAGTGRLTFGKYADAMARAMEIANQNFLKLVKNKAMGKVTVHARTTVHNFDQSIEPDDIKNFFENSVVLKAEAPEEREREALLALRLWNGGNGIISQYEAMRRSGVTNPLEEQNQLAAEKLLELARPEQAAQVAQNLNLGQQRAQAASQALGGGQLGNQFLPGQSQLQRPGERSNQQARVASNQGTPSVFPQNLGGLDQLGAALGGAPGRAQGLPSGQTVRA
jgi:hypothetical protein|tara:strand:- start:439 stop:2295 length:1857 start_codon:yes stop_codon:yes gene_type:complete